MVLSVGIFLAGRALLTGVGHAFRGSPARVRLIDHHCRPAKDGAIIVNGQLANDGKTGNVQASAYVLLAGGRKVAANAGWDAYNGKIDGGSSDFFSATVPMSPDDQPVGCGVLLGDGAPKGVTYVGDGAKGGY